MTQKGTKMSEVTELMAQLRDGSMTLEEVAERFRQRQWPSRKVESPISAEEATSSATPSEIIAKAVPLRWVETQPSSMANTRPVMPPISGTKGSGIAHL